MSYDCHDIANTFPLIQEPAFEAVKKGEIRLAHIKRSNSNHVANNTGNNEWYISPEYINILHINQG